MYEGSPKIVVFDLDETLGYFTELGMFWSTLSKYIFEEKINQKMTKEFFNDVLDLYPEFLRPNILDVLKYLKRMKEEKKCDKILIYTNNQGPLDWANKIINYFECKLKYKIFDQIIGAFKVNGKRMELCRTGLRKNHTDLINCTKLPSETQICFLDDVFYPEMKNKNIYYINVKPYMFDLAFDIIIERFISSNLLVIDDTKKCFDEINCQMEKYNYIYLKKTNETHMLDIIISKKIFFHIKNFFKLNTNKIKTRKKKIKNTIKTLKNKIY